MTRYQRAIAYLQIIAVLCALACLISAGIHDRMPGYATRAIVEAHAAITFAILTIALAHIPNPRT